MAWWCPLSLTHGADLCAWVSTLPSFLLRAGGGGVVCVIFLPEGVVEACPHCLGRWGRFGMKISLCSFQRWWHLRMSLPFFKASLERSYRHAFATSAPWMELLFVVLSLIVLHASLRFGLSSSWLVWP